MHALLVNKMDGEILITAGEEGDGIYIIISGLVRIETAMDDHTSERELLSDVEYLNDVIHRESEILATMSTHTMKPDKIQEEEAADVKDGVVDYLGSGSIIGEVALLTNQPRKANVICATAVEVCFQRNFGC